MKNFICTIKFTNKAFTLAEVLITLAIIGVVASLSVPSLIKNYQQKQYDSARSKVLKTVGEAGKMLAIDGSIKEASNAKDFVENYLSKNLKMIKTCDNAKDCGFPITIKRMNGTQVATPTLWTNLNPNISGYKLDKTSSNKSYFFVTAEGFTFNLFYNKNCVSGYRDLSISCPAYTSACTHYSADRVCFNALYDMNGEKNPNEVGKDIGFVTVFYPSIDTVAVAPGVETYKTQTTYNNTNGQKYCNSLKGGNYTLPSMDELSSMTINRDLISNASGSYWSGTSIPNFSSYVWGVANHGSRHWDVRSTGRYVRCIKR